MIEQISDKLYSWASILEHQTREQARLASTMDFVYPHVAIMPDAHVGKGACVGMVLPTLHAIIPSAVGVDIGCGMYAVRTQFTMEDIAGLDLSELRVEIEKAIPLGWHHNSRLRSFIRPLVEELEKMAGADQASEISPEWHLQVSSLGRGNHFIEMSKDAEGRIWFFLHSGSRGVGNRLANKHIEIAQEKCKKVRLPHRDLAYLDEADAKFWDYIEALKWGQHFALMNREGMMRNVISCFEEWLGKQVRKTEVIQCHHNYTEREEHFGKTVWLSRKGAIDASVGKMGLIPGSMADASYVVEGKGNALSLNSSPHGAGRNYSRGEAKRTFTVEQLEKSMEGIEWNREHGASFLDEISGAYKPVRQVMEDAADLVTVKYELRQILNVKGD